MSGSPWAGDPQVVGDRLAVDRAAAESERAALRDSMAALRSDRGGAADDDEHDPDGAPLSGEWSRLRGLIVETDARLAEIDAALERLQSGVYGICESCGRPIADARLEARPTARYCIDCAERLQRA
jgi:RNA polymerase-binding transcription factor DksA